MRTPSLPQLAKALLRRTVPADWCDDIERDLEEAYAERRQSTAWAPLWLWSQVALFAGRFVLAGTADEFRNGGISREGWALDLKHSARRIRKHPWSNALLIATIAIAIGATASVFTVVNGVLLKPLPYSDPEQLVRVWEVRKDWLDSPNVVFRSVASSINPNAPMFFRWLEQPNEFETLGAYVDSTFKLQTGAQTEAVHGQEATSGFFDTLGLDPLLGRGLQLQDDVEGAARVVVLSEDFWHSRLQSSNQALGTALNLNGEPHTIVGVMPRTFGGYPELAPDSLLPAGGPQLWTPLAGEARRGDKSINVVGRVGPEVTLNRVRDQLQAVQQVMASERSPDQVAATGERGVRVARLLDSIVSDVRSTLWFLLAATGLVLLVATVNIANILMARAIARRREVAVRSALGAGSSRLIRAQLVESLMLFAVGGAGGIALTWLALPTILNNLPPGVPRQSEIGVSLSVLLCGLASTGATALLAGTIPSVLASRTDPQEAMRSSTRSFTADRGASRLRTTMVAVEIALAVILLVGAGLLASSYQRLWSQERGFEPGGIASFWIEPDWSLYSSSEDYAQFVSTLEQQFNQHPNLEASACNHLPLSGQSSGTRIVLQQDGQATTDRTIRALLTVGLNNYREIMRIPLRQGRDFGSRDTASSARVAMVNETMARTSWPDGSALGRRIKVDDSDWIEVVGVVADAKHAGLEFEVDPKIYLPASQSNRNINEWIFRVQGDVALGLAQAKEILARTAPSSPVTREMLLERTIADSVALPRARSTLVTALAGIAALLALLGVYGLLTFSVTQRTKEIGVRIALGARSSHVVATIVGGGLKTVLLGLAIGVPMSWFTARALAPFLFRTNYGNPIIYLTVAVGLIALSSIAATVPARRASQVDPVEVLGDD